MSEEKNQQNQVQQLPRQSPMLSYFIVCGQVEYRSVAGDEDSPLKYRMVDGIYPSTQNCLSGLDLAKIQRVLQRSFHNKMSRITKTAPEVTDVTIVSASFIGLQTEEDFRAGITEAGLVQEEQEQQGEAPKA